MKHHPDYLQRLKGMVEELNLNNIDLLSPWAQSQLKPKEKFEVFLLCKFPWLFKLYVDIKFSKYKV